MKQPKIFGLLELRTKFSFRCHFGKPTIGGDSYNCIDVGSGRVPKSTNASQTHSQLSFEYRLVGIRNEITNTSTRKSAITIVIKTTGLLEFRKCMSHAFLQLAAFMESSVCVCACMLSLPYTRVAQMAGTDSDQKRAQTYKTKRNKKIPAQRKRLFCIMLLFNAVVEVCLFVCMFYYSFMSFVLL